ncbi:MAG TPA: Y-family DNA polymerase [Candidatus Saccharimonadia bacterium]|nr:Y-family DNA polymerase [Candidatus Saccharimonadia bacterium]
MKPVFALVDCNNFFVSCERLFRPDLEEKPVVVLSSNDGCAISRSAEAKSLGIPMAAPVYQYRQLFKDRQVVQFSANFELYGDISERIVRLLTEVTPRTEVYSVDESFLDLSQLDISDYQEWGRLLRERILREVGMPVSIGIAPTKTLAKLANHRAKKTPELGGVLDLVNLPDEDKDLYMLRTPIDEIWGVGWRLTPRLKAEGVFTALDLARLRPRYAQQLMGIHGRQMVAELNGLACHQLELFGRVRQTVMNGRMFGEDTGEFLVIESAIASLTARAAHSLRREGLLARGAAISLSNNRFKPGYQRQNKALTFHTPTADTGYITARLVDLAGDAFNPGEAYHRANVYLYDLVSQDALQPDLFGEVDVAGAQSTQARLAAVDAVNRRFGKRTLYFAAEDLSRRWEPKHRLRSQRYTTSWDELPAVKLS